MKQKCCFFIESRSTMKAGIQICMSLSTLKKGTQMIHDNFIHGRAKASFTNFLADCMTQNQVEDQVCVHSPQHR